MPAVLGLVYLLLAHAAALTDRPAPALGAGFVLALLLAWPGLRARRPTALLGLLLAAAGLALLARAHLANLPLFAPPVLFNLFFGWLFGHTLAAGRMPLIERFARAMGQHPEPLDPAIVRYARAVTVAWTVLFLLLAALNLLLALFAEPDGLLAAAGIAPPLTVPLTLWSLFANLLNYLIVGAFFVLEFLLRRRRFANLPYRSLGEFLRRLAALGPAFWRQASGSPPR